MDGFASSASEELAREKLVRYFEFMCLFACLVYLVCDDTVPSDLHLSDCNLGLAGFTGVLMHRSDFVTTHGKCATNYLIFKEKNMTCPRVYFNLSSYLPFLIRITIPKHRS